MAHEKTADQVLVTTGVDGELAKSSRRAASTDAWPAKVRKMRHDPTVGICRDLYSAPFFAADWTVESDGAEFKDAEQMVLESVLPHRIEFLEATLRGLMDFGWQSFEVVKELTRQGYVRVTKLKPLLQDITTILVDGHGRLLGVRNRPVFVNLALTGQSVTKQEYQRSFWTNLWGDDCLLINREVEGTNWYGEPLMYRVESSFDSWNECEEAAKRYDTKIAGAHWVIHYPVGTSSVDGEEVDNYEIAQRMSARLKSSGIMAVPRKLAEHVEDLDSLDDSKLAWKIELISANGSGESSFVGRQKYLDALKARGFGIPERAVFEGQFGTKAEAEAHADFAISNIEMAHTKVLAQLNAGLTDPLLELNKGPAYVGKVRVKASPLTDVKLAKLREMFSSYFQTEEGRADLVDGIDWAAIQDMLGVPAKDQGTMDA